MKCLLEKLGKVDAERFVSLLSREPFDYTKWRENLFENVNVREISREANEYSKSLQN